MGNFELFKRKEKKRFIGTCPTNLEKCYDPICCGGCAQLKNRSVNLNVSINTTSY